MRKANRRVINATRRQKPHLTSKTHVSVNARTKHLSRILCLPIVMSTLHMKRIFRAHDSLLNNIHRVHSKSKDWKAK